MEDDQPRKRPATRADGAARWDERTAAAAVWARLADDERARIRSLGLSDREMEVVACAVAEQSQKQIAATLGVSANTVKTHARTIARKARFASLAELASYVRSSGRRVAGGGDDTEPEPRKSLTGICR